MARHCPHLGLQGDRDRLFLVPDRRHRCYRSGQPERVAQAYKEGICLTSSHRGCLRLAAPLPSACRPAPQASAAAGVSPAHYPEMRPMPARAAARRRLTCVESMVLGLVLSIALAACFVGYAVVHRLQVGPGMQAVAMISVPVVATGASPGPGPTLLPATPPATAVVVTPGAPPTSIPEPPLPAVEPVARPSAASPPTRLAIAKIGLDVPVLPVSIRTIRQGGKSEAVWDDLPNAGGFHYTSAYPGNAGNTVINGHRDIQGGVFRHLERLEVGDEIVVYVGEVPYAYQVAQTLVVPETFASAAQRAENLRLIGPWPEERLTLVTCTPVGLATHRLLVIARPAEQGAVPPALP